MLEDHRHLLDRRLDDQVLARIPSRGGQTAKWTGLLRAITLP